MSIETHPSFRWSQRPFEARRGRSPADAQRFVAAMSVRSLPLASAYDPVWAYSHAMGPNPLWLAEIISRAIELKPGMRVLDLGCGTASSSILLAREFGVSVCAADLWRSPDDNLLSIDDAGSRDLVLPIRCEGTRCRSRRDISTSLSASMPTTTLALTRSTSLTARAFSGQVAPLASFALGTPSTSTNFPTTRGRTSMDST